MMIDREKVIKAFELCLMPSNKEEIENDVCSHEDCPYYREYNGGKCISAAVSDAFALLKEHEKATIEPKRIDLTDETKAWLDKMDAVNALGNIADICMDWDGYRTANGLGGLINEIWAYARYCADRLLKAQEPRVLALDEMHRGMAVWLEDVDKADVVLAIGGSSAYKAKCFITANDMAIAPKDAEYGIRWRAWTATPTDEQRRAVKWK